MSRLSNLSLGSRDGCRLHSLFAGFCLFLMVSVIPAAATVIINELMYSSYEPWATTNDTEYVELLNIGTQAVDLVNYRLDQGVDFDKFESGTILAPGQLIVICEDLFVFTNYYTDVTNAVGNYEGGLSGGGERVTLSRFDGESWVEEDSIAYVDFGPSDGDGPSLELVHPNFHVMRDQYAGAWYASEPILSSRGTPGTTNSVFDPTVGPVVGDVIHDPPLPPAYSAIRVTCKAFPATEGVAPELSVWYRKDDLNYTDNENPNEWQITPMSDNGFSGDAVAGDNVFTSYIPTNGSLITMEANDILEFKIHAVDASSAERLYPIEAWSGAQLQSLSYLCKFGTDAGYTGEYMTYHILMTKSNQDSTALFDVPPENELNQDGWHPYGVLDWEEQGLYKHPPYLDFLHDCTVVTSDGKIFYNCGVRKRGDSRNSSRNDDYRVSLPENVVHNGSDRLTFMFNEVFDNVFGNHVGDNVGYGAVAIDSGIARLWVNDHFVNAGFGCVAQMGALSRSFFKDRFGDDDPGNFYYVNKKPFVATLAYDPSISSYMAGSKGYGLKGVNTNTAYYEVQELTRRFAMPYQTAHTNLPPVVDIRSVARTCAAMVALNNTEGGYCAPESQGADEGRFYMRGSDGKFVLIPWDLDSIIGANAYVWWWPSANGVGNAYRNILYTKPGIPYYAGDCVDIMTNYLSDANLQVLFEEMGSLMPSGTRIGWRNTFTSQRNAILGKIYTGFTLSVGGNSVDEDTLAVITGSSSVNISGRASQMYVQEVEVNGAKTELRAWAPNGSSAASDWSYYSTNSFALTSTVNHVVVREMGGKKWGEYSQLRARDFYVINNSGSVSRSGTISGNTTWSGVNTISGELTVNSGATLTVDPGATLLFNSGASIHVTDGMLDINGSPASPVNMLPADEVAWAVEATGGSASISLDHARIVAGHVVGNAAASVAMYRCHQTDFTLNSFTSTPLLIQECLISEFSDCGIELVNAPSASVVWKTTVSDSVGSGDAKGISISGSSLGNITNCLIRGISGSAIDSTTTSSGLMVCDSLIYNCGTGIVATGTAIMNHDNTIDSCAVGLLGSAQTVSDVIIVSNSTSISSGPATVSYSDVQLPGTTLYPGANNLNQNPWFSQVATNDYRLLVQSSCIGNASDGGDMGARFPAGANPATPVLINGTNVGASQINITWTDNSGSEEYTFQIQRSNDDNGPWVTIGHAAADSTNFVDSGLSEDDSFFYRLRAIHNRGQSYWSESFQARTGLETTTQLLIDGLRVTEIMYNPDNSPSDVHEFIELKNVGGVELDLSGLYFDKGIAFTFSNGTTLAAGDFFVLVKNVPAFEGRYPTTNYHGVFENGSLNNDEGERVRIMDTGATEIVDVEYVSSMVDPAWYATADGGGYSIVIADLAGDPKMPGSWRASSFVNGSPGMDDPASPHEGIVINEILSHTDTPLGDGIELHNTSASGIDVGGWYLSDNVVDLKKYQIPGPQVIAAGGYYTFYETNSFGPYFALHEHGEEVYLSSASGTNLTSFRTWVTFGATANGVSLGRYTRSDGQVDLTAMASYTDAASNSAPLVGPVVISEIMYNPIDGSREYVELQNIAATNVPLFDTVFPSNSWKMTGAFDYTFPTNIWMAPGEIFLIVDAEEAIFRAAYGYTNQDARIFGPFIGDLDNNGETVRLMKAGRRDLDGLPYIVGDAVRYNDVAPWPWAADNDGPSLERKVLADYGNDPTNWIAGSMGGTPGAANNVAGLPTVGFEDATGKTMETNVTVYATILLNPPFNESVTVDYIVTGTASNTIDYNLTSGSVIFWPNDTKVTIPIQVIDDVFSDEYDETVQIQLTTVSANALRGGNRIYTLKIVDTDPTVVEPPTISVDGMDVTGTHDYSFEPTATVTMTSTVPNAVIHYNLYGNPPTASDNIYTGAFELACSAKIMARAFFGGCHQSDVAQATLLAQAPPLILPSPLATFARILSSEDDCDQTFIGRDPVSLAEPSVRTTEGVFKWSGFRFDDVGIASNAVITNSYIQFTSFGVGSAPKPIYIFGEAADDPPSFANAPIDLRPSGRNLTTNFVMWNPSSWPMPSSRGLEQRTPDLSAIVNEVISRPGWATSNAIVFVITNANLGEVGVDLAITAFDSSPSMAAELIAVRWFEERTNFFLGVQTNGGGIITGGNQWFDVAATATISYVAATHYEFSGWSGRVDVSDKYNNPLDLIMDQDRGVVGVFSPYVTSNSTPYWWLAQYYPTQTNDLESLAASDTDSDGMTAAQEYLCDTDPNNPTSVLEVVHSAANGGGVDITWPASPDRIYSLYCTTNLHMYAGPVDVSWSASPVVSSLFGNMSGTNTYTHSDPPTNFFFYRIGVAIP